MAPIYKNFIYDEPHGFIFAYVPKVACTNWKSLLRHMAGESDWLDNRRAHDKVGAGLRYLDLSGPEAELLQRPDIRRYAMVRDPYSRVLSAYLNKIERNLPAPPERKGEDHFVKVTRHVDAWRREALDPARHPEANFEVFLLWLRDSGSWLVHDEHWAPQTVLLRHPEVRFDFVGRFERLPEDAATLLGLMGCDVPFPTQKDVNFAPTGANAKLGAYYDAATRDIVRELYREDFTAWDYDAALSRSTAMGGR